MVVASEGGLARVTYGGRRYGAADLARLCERATEGLRDLLAHMAV